ncbi:MAG: L,D-transpeptidase [Gemmatimonadetes bacterium]|nr:L,D-transpeptidase [Gemmatimonadota bacterium]
MGQPDHRRGVLLLDLLRSGSVHNRRRSGPGVHLAKGRNREGRRHPRGRVVRRVTGLLLALCAGVLPLEAQLIPPDGGEVRFRQGILERGVVAARPLLGQGGRYVVVHLAENRVFVFDDPRAIWSAPAGTGTGFRLDTGEHRWKFSTPRGLFRVRNVEKDPMWEAPDWHYVEKGLPIPSASSPSRLMRGVMGTTAIYLGDGIAIHGTNQPGLLLDPDPERRRVSHGCIRLTNEAARALMHLVDVGTPVLIY